MIELKEIKVYILTCQELADIIDDNAKKVGLVSEEYMNLDVEGSLGLAEDDCPNTTFFNVTKAKYEKLGGNDEFEAMQEEDYEPLDIEEILLYFVKYEVTPEGSYMITLDPSEDEDGNFLEILEDE